MILELQSTTRLSCAHVQRQYSFVFSFSCYLSRHKISIFSCTVFVPHRKGRDISSRWRTNLFCRSPFKIWCPLFPPLGMSSTTYLQSKDVVRVHMRAMRPAACFIFSHFEVNLVLKFTISLTVELNNCGVQCKFDLTKNKINVPVLLFLS